MNLRASETYKSSVQKSTYCHCLSKKDLLDLMLTFPDAKACFQKRAQARRIEFRRIKRQYEHFSNVDRAAELQGKEELDPQQYAICHYSEKSPDMPPFLIDNDYYFDKTDLATIEDAEIQEISDSEMQTRTTQEEIERKQKEQTNRSLEVLVVSAPLLHPPRIPFSFFCPIARSAWVLDCLLVATGFCGRVPN